MYGHVTDHMKEPCTHKLIGLQPCLASSTAWPQLEGKSKKRLGEREGGGRAIKQIHTLKVKVFSHHVQELLR